jgi:hypothetical protein
VLVKNERRSAKAAVVLSFLPTPPASRLIAITLEEEEEERIPLTAARGIIVIMALSTGFYDLMCWMGSVTCRGNAVVGYAILVLPVLL